MATQSGDHGTFKFRNTSTLLTSLTTGQQRKRWQVSLNKSQSVTCFLLFLTFYIVIVILKLETNVPYTNNANCTNGKEMSSQTSERQMNARTKRKQTPRTTTSTYESCRNLDSFSLSFTVKNSEYVRQRRNAKKKIKKWLFSRIRRIGSFHVVVLQKPAKKWTKNYNARLQSLLIN